ncbi:hypothetical protein [Marispirochaeta aestuarii]|uniref:hypothetical protein n=1 Tax=Marispirochaeta aestuarii TaxID=1963862 RepID=UPI0029C78FD3|nr:hypothetical protein [Marispirochaeta aestuarii]
MGITIETYLDGLTAILMLFYHDSRCETGLISADLSQDLCARISDFSVFFHRFVKSFCEINRDIDFQQQFLDYLLIEINKNFLIIDYVTFLRKTCDGPFFKLHNMNTNWLSFYGKVIEEYSLQILSRIYPKSTILQQRFFSQHEYFIDNHIFEIDAAINNPESIIFIEIKNAFLPASAQNANNPDQYIDVLNERYGISVKGAVKWVGQLSRIIQHYGSGLIDTLPKEKEVFPVLIVNDVGITTPLTNKYLCEEFQKLVDNSTLKNDLNSYNGFIHPLVIINLE